MKSSAFWRLKQFKAANNSGMGEKWAFFCRHQPVMFVLAADSMCCYIGHFRVGTFKNQNFYKKDMLDVMISWLNYFQNGITLLKINLFQKKVMLE